MNYISFIIPTLNAQNVIENCLKSISHQNFKSIRHEILIIDGGSTDNTLKIAKKYHAVILKNPLKTAEAGKAVGIRHAHGQFICLIDSDNILPHKNWLQKMFLPFSQNPDIIGSEPISFTYRKKSGIIERYSALIGANDPYAFITGVYDKKNFINYKWTGLNIEYIDKIQYILLTLKPRFQIPTIGANGTIFKTDFLQKNLKSDYLFDIDILSQVLNQTNQPLRFAKVKTSIIHTYCENSIKKFIRKQKRRLVDYYTYQNLRQYPWKNPASFNQLKFTFYTILIVPALIDSFRGFIHQPDSAWFFHLPACIITLYVYSLNSLKNRLGLLHQIDRNKWKQ